MLLDFPLDTVSNLYKPTIPKNTADKIHNIIAPASPYDGLGLLPMMKNNPIDINVAVKYMLAKIARPSPRVIFVDLLKQK